MTGKNNSAEKLLSKALEKTSEVKKELELAEDELAVAHAVLETKLAKDAHEAEVGRAVDATAVAKNRVGKSAKQLKDVKTVLKDAGGKETNAD